MARHGFKRLFNIKNKNQKFPYYVKAACDAALPASSIRKRYDRIIRGLTDSQLAQIEDRAKYYVPMKEIRPLGPNAIKLKDFKVGKHSAYCYDLRVYLRYFNPELRIDYEFGDVTFVPESPAIVKSRPIHGDIQNSAVFKLDKMRHFNFVDDPYTYEQKKDLMVWRGSAHKKWRTDFLDKYFDHPLCDVGHVDKKGRQTPWNVGFMSINEQLAHKFAMCIEGNDVATNLKWAMSSNSLVIMPESKYETWFMEGRLEAGKHFVLVRSDYEDVAEKMEYYLAHPDEAKQIIRNAQAFVSQFTDKNLEEAALIRTLERYFEMTGQSELLGQSLFR